MKPRYIKCFSALLALILTACASTSGGTPEQTDSPVKAETLMETVCQVESLFESVPTVMLAASETDTLRAETAETGVRVSARWSDAAWTVYFAVYGENGQMLGAAAAPDSVTEWETEIECEAGQADTVKMFRLDRDLRPVAPAISASLKGEKPADEPDRTDILVAFFSATGTTRGIAAQIADILGADSYEITPAIPYTSADLNYNDSSTRATMEQNDASARPEITGTVANMAQYNVVFLGYPIWWGQAPRIISTFLESYDFTGKTIIPFCTSGSSPIGTSASNLHPLVSGADWREGRRFAAGSSRDTVKEWIDSLDLPGKDNAVS